MEEEPTLISLRESCIRYYDELDLDSLNGINISSPESFVESFKDVIYAFNFGISVQKYMKEQNIHWNDLIERIELIGKIPDDIIEYLFVEQSKITTVKEYMKLDSQTCLSMLVQSILCHTNDKRENITERNIRDSSTLEEYIVDLRMIIYMEKSKVKRGNWLSMIGNVTYEASNNATEEQFRDMIGRHSHSCSKACFWAMAKAALFNTRKKEIFLSKSNDTVSQCFVKIATGKV